MKKVQKDISNHAGQPMEKGNPPAPRDTGVAEDCRCREMSKRTFPELLKVMIRDLSFWKKKN